MNDNMSLKQATLLAIKQVYADIYHQIKEANRTWFLQEWVKSTILTKNLVLHYRYLNQDDPRAFEKLLLAYKLKGTYEGVVYACESLMGSGIRITSTVPGAIDIEISKVATKFYDFALGNKNKTKAFEIQASPQKAQRVIAGADDENSDNLFNLLKEFLLAGIKYNIIIKAQTPVVVVNGSFVVVNDVYINL